LMLDHSRPISKLLCCLMYFSPAGREALLLSVTGIVTFLARPVVLSVTKSNSCGSKINLTVQMESTDRYHLVLGSDDCNRSKGKARRSGERATTSKIVLSRMVRRRNIAASGMILVRVHNRMLTSRYGSR